MEHEEEELEEEEEEEGEDGSARSTDDDDEEGDTFYSTQEQRHEGVVTNGTKASNQQRRAATTQFQPGAIVRVSVRNFVTYEYAEFFPGPNLNMVIGPNGTGKSSLVCAICLGLGYHSNVLGRASAFGDFVKHGSDSAKVEIELQKRQKDSSNYVIRLRINREDNTRKFWLNGDETPLKKIQSTMRSLRIQIDNLCQFLPQDKVAEFAGLSPVDLLAKTLQAAAPPQMIQWQNQLKEIYAEQRDAQRHIEAEAEQLKVMESRQQGLQADVDRLREREQIQKDVAELEMVRIVVAYLRAKEAYGAAREEKKQGILKLKRLEEECGPSMQAVNQKQDYCRRLAAVLEDRKKAMATAPAACDRLLERIENLDSEIEQLGHQQEAEEQAFQSRKGEIRTARQRITALEAKLKGDYKEFVPAEWNTKIVRARTIGRRGAPGSLFFLLTHCL